MNSGKKKTVFLIAQIILLIWFFLDMIGVYFDDAYLVTRSYKDDGIFFLIYLTTMVVFIIKEKIGKWAVTVWSVIWLIAQFANHELITLTGNGYENVSRYFEGSLKWIDIEGVYVPDVYHTVLHILLIAVVIIGINYIFKKEKQKET